ncbi:Nad-binding protein [Colletotrichum higginsianum IMI 349063]|uniref:Nad-binding protein n=1 Tax=Colletotrichum higginsianum (strain IMI 349063) TaxID=759273 RepID=A0A1B7YFG8_COLHI|nr:Nad-binding protein [Colletotrichum higginsianum IMI 349063]OBR10518.1 Nad-binding protein [Colletotrichum higginsianum IMI 349063]
MALNLARRFPITVWNRSPSKYPPFTKHGANIGESPAAVARQSEVIFTMLFDGPALTSILDDETFTAALRGKTLINTSSVIVDTSERVADQVRKAGGHFVEMPVSGSKIPAEQGKLVGLMAGDPAAAERVRPFVEPLTSAAVYCGPVGYGLKTKYAVNLFLNNLTAGLAESFSLARAQGLDLEAFGKVLDAGPMASAYSKIKVAKLLNGDWSPQASVKDCFNSTQLIVEAARQANVRAPFAELCGAVYGEAKDVGLSEEDMIAVYKVFQEKR